MNMHGRFLTFVIKMPTQIMELHIIAGGGNYDRFTCERTNLGCVLSKRYQIGK